MSQAICPDCGCPQCPPFNSADIQNASRCELCGWIGSLADAPLRKLIPHMHQSFQQRIEARKNGDLGVLRYLCHAQLTEDEKFALIMEMSALLSVETDIKEQGIMFCTPPASENEIIQLTQLPLITEITTVSF